jgi:hypothetical protein
MECFKDAQQAEKEMENRPECCGQKMSLEDDGDSSAWLECEICGECQE